MNGPLDGIVVADFSRVLAGPYATMLLGDLGAEVIKVERPGHGDDTRAWGPPYTQQGQSTYFAGVNRNKSTRAIDLRTPEGQADSQPRQSRQSSRWRRTSGVSSSRPSVTSEPHEGQEAERRQVLRVVSSEARSSETVASARS